MSPKKRPAAGGVEDLMEEADDTRQRASRVGFKDARRLFEALSPFFAGRFFINYPAERGMKYLDKKKLTTTWAGLTTANLT